MEGRGAEKVNIYAQFSNFVCSNFLHHQSAHHSPVVHGPLVHATQGYHTLPIVHATTEYHAAQSVHTYAVTDNYSKAAFAETADGAGSVSGSYSVALPDVTYEGTAVFPEVSQVWQAVRVMVWLWLESWSTSLNCSLGVITCGVSLG